MASPPPGYLRIRLYIQASDLCFLYRSARRCYWLCFSFHCWLKDFFGNTSFPLWRDQDLPIRLIILLFIFPLAIFIQLRRNIAIFQILQAIFSENGAKPLSAATCLFSSSSSCRFILTAQTSVQLPQRDEA